MTLHLVVLIVVFIVVVVVVVVVVVASAPVRTPGGGTKTIQCLCFAVNPTISHVTSKTTLTFDHI